MINSVLKLPHSKFRFNWTNISSFVPEFLRWGVSRDHSRPLPVRVFFCCFFASQPPVSVLHNFVDGRGGGRVPAMSVALSGVLSTKLVLAAVWKAKWEFIQCFFISKNRFSDIKRYLLISENRFFDFLISKNIFWYQNIDFFISKIDFVISEIDFLISENIFWYQKYFWYKKWKSFLISKSKSYFLISKNEFLISENTE